VRARLLRFGDDPPAAGTHAIAPGATTSSTPPAGRRRSARPAVGDDHRAGDTTPRRRQEQRRWHLLGGPDALHGICFERGASARKVVDEQAERRRVDRSGTEGVHRTWRPAASIAAAREFSTAALAAP
jgi:hypothetical protein